MDREEEILSIQAIYNDEFNTFDDTHFEFRSSPVILSIYVPLSYPTGDEALRVSLDSNGLGISRMQLLQLQSHLVMLIRAKHVAKELVLLDITEETCEFTAQVRGDVALMNEEEDEEQEHIYVAEEGEPKDRRINDPAIIRGHMGKVTLDNIMSRLPPNLKLLHAEIVLRSDLRERYLSMRETVQHAAVSASNKRDRRGNGMYDKFGEEHVVFHGTMRQNVGSIVRSGFVVPGSKARDGTEVQVSPANTYGQGIYTSPDPSYSLSYTDYTETHDSRLLPGQKLIVSVAVLGRQFNITDEWVDHTELTEGYQSHISPNLLEYIVFNSAQVLPLYVLHLANGPKSKHRMPLVSADSMPVVTADSRAHLGVQSRVAMTEYARKYLPTGYGPMTGRKFVVEAIAPVDDDEEMWGEYQYDEAEFRANFSSDRSW